MDINSVAGLCGPALCPGRMLLLSSFCPCIGRIPKLCVLFYLNQKRALIALTGHAPGRSVAGSCPPIVLLLSYYYHPLILLLSSSCLYGRALDTLIVTGSYPPLIFSCLNLSLSSPVAKQLATSTNQFHPNPFFILILASLYCVSSISQIDS